MNIVIAFQDRRPCQEIAYAARRAVEQALDRFAGRIRDVTVRIRDENGDKGGIDQRCSLALRTRAGEQWFLHDRDSSATDAVRRLVRRAARLVASRPRRRAGAARARAERSTAARSGVTP